MPIRTRTPALAPALAFALAAGVASAQQPPAPPPPSTAPPPASAPAPTAPALQPSAVPQPPPPGGQPPPPGYAPGYAPPPPGYGAPPPGYAPAPPGYPPGYYAPPPPYGYPNYGMQYGYGPSPELPPPIATKRRSVPLMGTGIALAALGAVGVIVGGAIYGTASNGGCATPFGFEVRCTDQKQQTTGAVFMAVGAGLLIVGIPLWAIGSKKIVDNDAQPATATATRASKFDWTF